MATYVNLNLINSKYFILYILRNFVIFCPNLKHKQSMDQPYEEKVSKNLASSIEK
jgi:hypothetical protein